MKFQPEAAPGQPFPPAEKKPVIEKTSQVEAPKAQDAVKFLPMIGLKAENLPSKGLPYPANAEIKYRPYTFGEVKKSSNSKGLTFRDNINFILEGIETSFPKEQLTIYDVMYLSLLRNISSVKGAGFKIPYVCPTCSHKGEKEVPMTEVEFKDIEAPKLPCTVEIGGRKVCFVPLSLGNFLSLTDKGLEEDDIALVAAKINNLQFEEAYELVTNLYGDDQEVIMEVEKILNHEIQPIKFGCEAKVDGKKCNTEMKVELVGGEALIMPFRKSKDSPRSRIQFG